MAHEWDPKVQTIFRTPSSDGRAGDTIHPSQLSHHFSSIHPGDHHGPLFQSSHQDQPRQDHGVFGVAHRSPLPQKSSPDNLVVARNDILPFQSSWSARLDSSWQSGLDEFDMRLLYDNDRSTSPSFPNKPPGRLSLPPRTLNNDVRATKFRSSQLSSNQYQQREATYTPFDESRIQTGSGNELQYPQMALPGKSKLAESIGTFSPQPMCVNMALSMTPILENFAFQPRKQQGTRTHSSSPYTISSPSQRVHLRRGKNGLRVPEAILQKDEAYTDNTTQPIIPQRRDIVMSNVDASPPLENGPPVIQGIQLVSTHQLPDRFRQVFQYPLFNAVQSKCFPIVYKSTDNMIVSAPTGSGKTAIMELAICKLVEGQTSGQFKIVYQAPTKSLCSERVRDWQKRFGHLHLQCAELTGDTDAAEMRNVGSATIIVTTPEKWDSITRKWKDHIKLLQMVKLFLIDEVHILKDIRGATLEAVVSRMKSIGAQVRVIALSATVPNSQDVATWLGKDSDNSHLPARREIFGEDFRPVRLEKHVYGFDHKGNDFAFDAYLDSKIPSLIVKHTKRKPIMVFCFTRKSCESTAAKLAEWWSKSRPNDRTWSKPENNVIVGHKELRELISCGVAFHHAGLDSQDRAAVEEAFSRSSISVICCTSTLAVGVNLPCHLVVIKNTVGYQEDRLKDYSNLELMQMLGRAGRPQFDNEAVAVIMTRSSNVDRYQKMISGQEVIESTLHLNLIEHLNSEIGLGTVQDSYTAKQWLAGTFLCVRMRQNPKYYKFGFDDEIRDADEKLRSICERDIKLLQDAKLITTTDRFACTDYGLAMSKYMVTFETMKLLLTIPKNAKMGQMIHIISQATDFKEIKMKAVERNFFRVFNKGPYIRFPIKDAHISSTAHKVSLMIQVQLGGVDLPSDKDFNMFRRQYMLDKSIIFDRVRRLVRCVVECKVADCDAIATGCALQLARNIAAGYWEKSPLQLMQISGIGPAATRKLVQADIKNVEQLTSIDASKIEMILSRNPPHGNKIKSLVANFPRLTLQVNIVKKILRAGEPVRVKIKAELHSLTATQYWNNHTISVTFFAAISNGELAHIWRGPIKKLLKTFEINFDCCLSNPADTIICSLACDEIVGTENEVTIQPGIAASSFPPKLRETVEAGEDFEWNDAEAGDFLAVVKTVESAIPGSIGPDTGGHDELDGFMDIDAFDVISKDDTLPREPVKMGNGNWQCNHRCAGGSTKKGAQCKHRCCHEGLDRPPKAKPKRDEKYKDKIKLSQPKLKLRENSESDYMANVEEIDLATDVHSFEYASRAPTQVRKLHETYTNTRSHELPLASKEKSYFSYDRFISTEHGFQRPDNKESDSEMDDFPLPSQLLKSDYFESDPMVAPNTSGQCFQEHSITELQAGFKPNHSDFPAVDHTETSESFADSIFDFHAFSSQKRSSPIEKRGLPTSPNKHRTKRFKSQDSVLVEEENDLPEWTKELPTEMIEYFKGSVRFVP